MERCFTQVTRSLFIRLVVIRGIAKRHQHTLGSKRETNYSKSIDFRLNRSIRQCRRCSDIHSQYLYGQLYKVCCGGVYKNSQALLFNKLNCNLSQSNCDMYVFQSRRARLHSGTHLNVDFGRSVPGNTQPDPADSSDSDSDKEDIILRPALEAVTPNLEPPHHVSIVPGKGPPPEPPVDCCMSGCANCVWIQYCEELKHYFIDGTGQELAKEAIENIENPGLKMFLKVELGFI